MLIKTLRIYGVIENECVWGTVILKTSGKMCSPLAAAALQPNERSLIDVCVVVGGGGGGGTANNRENQIKLK